MRILLTLALTLTVACAPSPTPEDAGNAADAGQVIDANDAGFPSTPGCDVPAEARETAWTSDPSLCLSRWSESLPGARGLALAPDGDLYVVARFVGIVALWDADGDGVSGDDERSVFANPSGANHGITFHDGFLYASSSSTVWRWEWSSGRRVATTAPETVVRDLPTGGHTTRTLLFDTRGRLLVSVGSKNNVDVGDGTPLPDRALIRAFDVASIPAGGHPASSGTLFATGLRNEVGLAYDDRGRLWGVENGRDQLRVDGVMINNDNPAEELHLYPANDGTFFGYPYCWTEYAWADGQGRGTQHVDPDMPGGHDDAWCRNPANNHPPALAMPAHLAPLGLAFVKGTPISGDFGALVIPSHGSWNRTPATGRTLMRATFDADGNVSEVEPIVGERGGDGSLKQGTWKFRPVDVARGKDEALYVSDDERGTVLRLGWTAD